MDVKQLDILFHEYGYEAKENGEKRNCLFLNAHYEGANSGHMAYSNIATFDYADERTLRFEGFYFKDKDGWITFLRGDAEPGF